jgi:hypothetical protein
MGVLRGLKSSSPLRNRYKLPPHAHHPPVTNTPSTPQPLVQVRQAVEGQLGREETQPCGPADLIRSPCWPQVSELDSLRSDTIQRALSSSLPFQETSGNI